MVQERYSASGAAMEILQKRYGGLLQFNTLTQTLQNGFAGEIIPFDPERVAVVFVNVSAEILSIGPMTNPSILEGIQLGIGSAGILTFTEREHTILPCLAWFGSSAGVPSDIWVLTVRRDVRTGPVLDID